jgi:UDP-N-acetylglucosamine 2-epimerase
MVLQVLRRRFPGKKIHAIGPNNDPGHRGILRAYGEAKELWLEMSVRQEIFWTYILLGGLLVGNSSAGIIEAATFGVPVVNIGERQAGRERNENVIDVGWNAKDIERGIRKALTDKALLRRAARRKNLYGDGRAAERIVKVLEGFARAGGVPLEKRFHL